MKFVLENIGSLDRAEIELGDITVVCGENNTGKTYAAYSLYGFLKKARELSFPFEIDGPLFEKLLETGKLAMPYDLGKIVPMLSRFFSDAGRDYSAELTDLLSSDAGRFSNSRLSVELGEDDFSPGRRIGSSIHFNADLCVVLQVSVRGGVINVQLRDSHSKGEEKSEKKKKIFRGTRDELLRWVGSSITSVLLKALCPNVFIASSMCGGLAVFYEGQAGGTDEAFGAPGAAGCSLPMRHSLESLIRFTRARTVNLGPVANEHPEILRDFEAILGGEYVMDDAGVVEGVRFKPDGSESSFSLVESSSSVRSLLMIGLYLKYRANYGNVLMIDEPESSLHPENQRRMARLFVRLANAGVKVFITTHSDYILKELEALLLLNRDKPHLRLIRERLGYGRAQLLKESQLRVYMAELCGDRRCALTRAEVSQERGVNVPSFDRTIDDMNSLFDEISWSGEL
ncbi:MAG: ATP-binding protein [Synergistaceae bacterium]|nr:ATP-binding protein [Synergistaceae bacterium]